jgi:beta-lactam-binding protein with PASTA domain
VAAEILRNYGLKYIIEPEPEDKTAGFVVQDQYPKAGKKVKRGSSVYIYSE